MQIRDAVRMARNTLGRPEMERIEPTPIAGLHPPAPEVPTRSMFIRCPLPFVNSSSDNTRNFYVNSIPYFRIIPRGQ